MKSADEFWEVIGRYNIETFNLQVIFSILLIGLILLSFFKKERWVSVTLNTLFGVLFFFIGIFFFLITDKSVTAMIFGPCFIVIGGLFFIQHFSSGIHFQSPTWIQIVMYGLVLCYPVVSYLLGHYYPQQVLYILPCPLVSFALITCSRLKTRNKLLYIMLIIWGLTGIKAFIFDVKEDLILLVVGIFGLIDSINYYRSNKKTLATGVN